MNLIWDKIIETLEQYHLKIRSNYSNGDYYICFTDLDYPNYIGVFNPRKAICYLYDSIHLKHEKIVADKNHITHYTDIEPFTKHLNELIRQKKTLLNDIKVRKMLKDFK